MSGMLGLIVVTSPTARSPAAAVRPAAAEGCNICSADFPCCARRALQPAASQRAQRAASGPSQAAVESSAGGREHVQSVEQAIEPSPLTIESASVTVESAAVTVERAAADLLA